MSVSVGVAVTEGVAVCVAVSVALADRVLVSVEVMEGVAVEVAVSDPVQTGRPGWIFFVGRSTTTYKKEVHHLPLVSPN